MDILNLNDESKMKERRKCWDYVVSQRKLTETVSLETIQVKIIYAGDTGDREKSEKWAVNKHGLYVGYKKGLQWYWPPHKDTTQVNLYHPKQIDSQAALSAAVLISEAARFEPVRARVEAGLLEPWKPVKYLEIKPLCTKWQQLIDWKVKNGNKEAYREVVTPEDIRTFAHLERNPYGADREKVLAFIDRWN